jgi:S-adenosylmethionine synthetase
MELKRNKFNSSTTIYYMLLKRTERTQNYKRKLQLELMQRKKPMVSQPLKPLGTIDEVKLEATIACPSVEDTARKDTQ